MASDDPKSSEDDAPPEDGVPEFSFPPFADPTAEGVDGDAPPFDAPPFLESPNLDAADEGDGDHEIDPSEAETLEIDLPKVIPADARELTQSSDEDEPAPDLTDLVAALDRGSHEAPNDPVNPDAEIRRDATLERFIQFTLADTRYAVPVGRITEVAEVPPITPVPNVPPWVLGVANLRGEVLSIVDLRMLLELPQDRAPGSGRMLVARSGDEVTAGLVVDAVNGAAGIDPASLRQPTAPLSASWSQTEHPMAPYLVGVTDRDEHVLAVLDMGKLLDTAKSRLGLGT